jgi:hypothetical protein
MARALRVAVVSMALASWAGDAAAQHFGRNKVQYRRFESRVLKTEHFDVHYYPAEAEAAADASWVLIARRGSTAFASTNPQGRDAIEDYGAPARAVSSSTIACD